MPKCDLHTFWDSVHSAQPFHIFNVYKQQLNFLNIDINGNCLINTVGLVTKTKNYLVIFIAHVH